MAKNNTKQVEEEISKKSIASHLFSKFDRLLKEYQPLLGEKKYVRSLKETADAIAKDIAEAAKKKKEKIEKEIKKINKKGDTEKKGPKQKKSKKIRKRPLTEENVYVEAEATDDED